MIKISLVNDKIQLYKNGELLDVELYIKNIYIQKEVDRILNILENNTKNIQQLYKYTGIEMYNFHRGTFVNKLNYIVYNILIIDSIINNFKEEDIIVETDEILMNDIAIEIFNVDVELKNKRINQSVKLSFNIRLKFFIRNFIGIFKAFIKLINRKEKILAITQAVDISNININGEKIHYDAQFGKILDKLKKDLLVIKVQYLNTKELLNKSNNLGVDFIPFELIIIIKRLVSKKLVKLNKIEDRLDELKYADFCVCGKEINNILQKYLFNDLRIAYFSYIKEVETASLILRLFNIKTVIATNEADRPRCFIAAANYNNIKTYGIQHGVITKTSNSYLVPTTDCKLVPKITFLWGEEFKKVLMSSTNVYNEGNLNVVGQLRTDYLVDKIKFCRTIKNDNKLKIMFATQPIDELIDESTQILFKALDKMKDYELLIKLHPNDNKQNFYSKCANENNITNFRIVKDKDLYDCILESDCIITVHSTVVIEAMLLKIPSVCILLPNYYDQGNFVKDGVAIGVETSEELRKILMNRTFVKNEKYIGKNIYKVDGNVCVRIENIIRN
ncbi:hypothetical protein [Clostridium sp.]|uniref:hypothetical protein n=1 Tax=Clostridium sp. TaxID=1506 RepID=UPI0032166C9C